MTTTDDLEATYRKIEAAVARGDLVLCPACEGRSTETRPCPTCRTLRGPCVGQQGEKDERGYHRARYCPTCLGGVYVTPDRAAPALLVADEDD